MRLLIMSDGTPHGTRVTDEYHKPIEGVTAIKFEQVLGEAPIINLTFGGGIHSGLMATMPEPEPTPEPVPATTETIADENGTTPKQVNPSPAAKRAGNAGRRNTR